MVEPFRALGQLLLLDPIVHYVLFSCDEDLDECLSSPCQNGGTCQQTEEPGNYSCTCLDDFEGHNCQELKIKTCEQFPCKNGGICRAGPSEWTLCNPSYEKIERKFSCSAMFSSVVHSQIEKLNKISSAFQLVLHRSRARALEDDSRSAARLVQAF